MRIIRFMQHKHNEKQESDDRSNKSEVEPLIWSEKPTTEWEKIEAPIDTSEDAPPLPPLLDD